MYVLLAKALVMGVCTSTTLAAPASLIIGFASGNSLDHGSLLTGLSPETKLILISDILLLLRRRAMEQLGQSQ